MSLKILQTLENCKNTLFIKNKLNTQIDTNNAIVNCSYCHV